MVIICLGMDWPRRLLVGLLALTVAVLIGVGLYYLWKISPSKDTLFNFILLFGVLAGLFLTAIGLVGPGLWQFYKTNIDWRRGEYTKLSSLFAGMSVHKLEQKLGPALFESLSKDGLLRESVFQGRDYWVQAIYDATGTVKFLGVTSTSGAFRPQYDTPLGKVTLLATQFNAILSTPMRIRYFTRGATAPSFYFDDYSGGNPTLYKTYTFGINEVGAFSSPYLTSLKRMSPFMSSSYTNRPFPNEDAEVDAFRKGSVINTYGETDVWFSLDEILKDFCIGPDPIRVRTVR